MKSIKGYVFFEDGTFKSACIEVEGNKISSVKEIDASLLEGDEADTFILPGFVDVHSHGCVGHDTCEASPEEIYEMAEFEASVGVTSYFPTTMTYDEEKLTKVVKNVKASGHKNIKGIYLEGPFISREKKGAQNEKYIMKPDASMIRRLMEASGNMVKTVAIAPEVEGGIEFIKEMSGEVNITIAHTMADYEVAKKAFEAGANEVTHLFNAMKPYGHRDPAVVGALFDNDKAFGELIADGIHVHEAVIRNTFKSLGSDRVILISDSMEATGMPNGDYQLGGQAVKVQDRKATLADGTIAGSASTLMDCFKHAVEIGVDVASAIFAATKNPAIATGIYDTVGSLKAGKLADILIMSNDFKLKKVIQSECDI